MNDFKILESNNNAVPFLSIRYSEEIFISNEIINEMKNFADKTIAKIGWIINDR